MEKNRSIFKSKIVAISVIVLSMLVVAITFLFSNPPKKDSFWKDLELPSKELSSQEKLSNYKRLQMEQEQIDSKKHKLLHKAELARKNPFAKLFEGEKVTNSDSTKVALETIKKVPQGEKQRGSFRRLESSEEPFLRLKTHLMESREASFLKQPLEKRSRYYQGKP